MFWIAFDTPSEKMQNSLWNTFSSTILEGEGKDYLKIIVNDIGELLGVLNTQLIKIELNSYWESFESNILKKLHFYKKQKNLI
jgi:hypothetical protein